MGRFAFFFLVSYSIPNLDGACVAIGELAPADAEIARGAIEKTDQRKNGHRPTKI